MASPPVGPYTPSLASVIAALDADRATAPASPVPLITPVYREFIADLETPVATLLKLRAHAGACRTNPHYCFLLESVEGGERLGRFSFVGAGPREVIIVGDAGTPGATHSGDPLVPLEAAFARSRLLSVPGVQLPAFAGGAVGYVGYDAVRYFEPHVAPRIDAQTDALGLPEALFMLVDTLVVFDHVRHTVMVLAHARLPALGAGGGAEHAAAVADAYAAACASIDALHACLEGPLPPAPPPSVPLTASPALRPVLHSPSRRIVAAAEGEGRQGGGVGAAAAVQGQVGASALAAAAAEFDWEGASNTGREGYEGFVVDLKGHIVEGDIIQAVASHRITRTIPPGCHATALDMYRQLRILNPSPYMFYLECGEAFAVVGASPEMLVEVDASRRTTTHPIAGTRRRGATPEEDDALAAELLADAKERAEHLMLVDLGRNDVGRVAAPGTVRVDSLMHIERYSHVMHIVSTVSGELARGRTCFDAFRSVFPAGTVSGAPKVRAVELVAGLETSRRGVYAGAVGCFGFNGTCDTAIAIRTLVVEGDRVHLQAGAGIVYDSQPPAEYDETLHKLRATMRAVEAAVKATTVVGGAGEGAARLGGAGSGAHASR